MKRLWTVVGTVLLSLSLLTACAGGTKPAQQPAAPTTTTPAASAPAAPAVKKLRIGMVTDTQGLSGSPTNKSFLDLAYDGLQKAKAELGAEITVLESREISDLAPNLRKLADQKYDLVVGVGFLFADAIQQTATAYKDTRFVIIDSIVDLPNVVSYVFSEEQGSFLAGALAAGLTTSAKTEKINPDKIIGFVGGVDSPLIRKFESGYLAGVKTMDPSVQVLSAFTGSFNDPAKGKELALAMQLKNADVIYHAAGTSGLGVLTGAKEKNYWAIGVNLDQHSVAPGFVAASMIKKVEVATFEAVKSVQNGTFKGGTVRLDIKSGGIDLGGLQHQKEKLPADLLTKIEKLKQMVIEGKIKVPTTADELKAFQPPTGF